MALPDDVLPEDEPDPLLNGDAEPAPELEGELPGLPPPDSSDGDFDSLTDVTTQEFESKNPPPVGDAEIASIPDAPVPPPEVPVSESTPRTGPLRDKSKTYRQRRDEFRAMSEVTQTEFQRKQGSPPSEEFVNDLNEFNASGGMKDGDSPQSGPLNDLMESDYANREQMGEMLASYARRLDQHTRFLEMQRL